jgi:hypothetical protein
LIKNFNPPHCSPLYAFSERKAFKKGQKTLFATHKKNNVITGWADGLAVDHLIEWEALLDGFVEACSKFVVMSFECV